MLYQSAFIRESTAGRYYFLPLGMRVRDKVCKIVEEEMNKAGAVKLITPVLHPIDLWKETSRTESVGFELMTVEDRSGGEFALGGTAEEMMVDLVRKFGLSYKDLPFNIYQFSQKFRDELRPRAGLLRVREFLMKDAYSFHVDEKDFQKEYQRMREAYTNIFKRMGLETMVVEADNGYIGGDYSHEFVVESPVGESRFLVSKDKKYAAHEDIAKFKKEPFDKLRVFEKNRQEKEGKLEEVKAVRGTTMEDGVKLHKMPPWQQIKDVMFIDDKGNFILAIIRGDLDVNETKLKNLTDVNELTMATDEEVRKLGSEPGFISPVGMNKKVKIVADDSLRTIKNAYGGANKKNTDLLNINIDRDYKPHLEGDIAMAEEGYLSESGSKLIEHRGIEVGNIFQLGDYYSKKMKATFTDKDGKEKCYYMGCYGIGIGRTLSTVAQMHHDDKGIIWPLPVAPFEVHLLALDLAKNKEVAEAAQKLYDDLTRQGVEVMYDDRVEASAGEKFADADLIGIPIRLLVSPKTLAKKSVEIKLRSEKENELVSLEQTGSKVKEILKNLSK